MVEYEYRDLIVAVNGRSLRWVNCENGNVVV